MQVHQMTRPGTAMSFCLETSPPIDSLAERTMTMLFPRCWKRRGSNIKVDVMEEEIDEGLHQM